MAQPYAGEIRLFAGNFAPSGWMTCDGQLLPIPEYEELFQLIGTTYGGDGLTTFALPDLRGRVPVHQGSPFVMGETGGVESVTLSSAEIPAHSHALGGSSAIATATGPAGMLPATLAEVTTLAYGTDAPATTLAPSTIGSTGGNQPHDNVQPFQCINYIICMFGIFPSPN